MSDSPAAPGASHRVTIVVPVYGHWPSLRDCVRSLIDHADPAVFDVLLVNDCGPEADAIEAGLRGLVYGRENFRYERNPHNLGFVGTCNRAAFELDTSGNDLLLLNSDTRVTPGALDELREVLLLSDEHGVACPRSNDATIASIPFHRSHHGERDAARAHEIFTAVNAELPRFYTAPVAVGFCFLIRRSIIDRFGLFDEIFGKGYNEENDFCLRINGAGYSSVIANRSFVFHVGSTSFGSEQRASLEARNSAILHARYPYYLSSVVSFIHNDYVALDRFADLLFPYSDAAPVKILLDTRNSEVSPTEATARITDLLKQLPDALARVCEISLAVAARSDVQSFSQCDRRVVVSDEIDELFHVGVTVAPVRDPEQLIALNRHCLHWVTPEAPETPHRYWQKRADAPYMRQLSRLTAAHSERILSPGFTAAELWQAASDAASAPVDTSALERRDTQIREIALLWQGARGVSAEAALHLENIRGSASYRLARGLASAASPIRRLLRR
ncbi:glycosyltransferase family 2 protein [Salinibacterium sp. SYSU T00001]|uniref:glycosyltransferase family 2 protein n=1 Tax=Homoserinimonas sedimenticola TaxID=2986805 RepID=UPI0022365D28|nr:glycosyltransferase family 2 protein [Salinibacterium sedimenticola]MCW4385048.1 glycosyltransferase family 2 protein [Salinibacterium sedimenticola]